MPNYYYTKILTSNLVKITTNQTHIMGILSFSNSVPGTPAFDSGSPRELIEQILICKAYKPVLSKKN